MVIVDWGNFNLDSLLCMKKYTVNIPLYFQKYVALISQRMDNEVSDKGVLIPSTAYVKYSVAIWQVVNWKKNSPVHSYHIYLPNIICNNRLISELLHLTGGIHNIPIYNNRIFQYKD